ncbi:hypothetical protein BJ322DRAFT_1114634 [Thelephora terrestris]|uniref:Transmembrane protein n=1 Tax=Thelephora terrestris TaxID=56493 RepID=A0A9P6L102_9AGAM|nr:hypothetical protein BJ322DRAFT_1114634 [Thelephora terrestris]
MTASYTLNESDKSLMSSVELWMSRLQLVTALSAFFASTDGLLLGRVGTFVPTDTSIGNILTHTTLSGALVLHISAAIISYLACFVLVKYNRISVPVTEEGDTVVPPRRETTATSQGGTAKSPQSVRSTDLNSFGQQPTIGAFEQIITIERVYLRNFLRTRPAAFTRRFYAPPSEPGSVTTPELQDAHNVLLRCNSVCVILTFVGLLLATIGIMAYVWTTFTLAAGIFVSVCFIISLATACYALH